MVPPVDRRSALLAIVGGVIVPIQVEGQTMPPPFVLSGVPSTFNFDATKFFDMIRENPFPGHLAQTQVDGMTYLMRAWRIKHHPNTGDVRWLSYLMATTFHETAYTMLPIKEYGSQSYLQGKPYWPYIGRGYVMLTWDYNYEKGAALTGEDLLNFPDLAMNPELSAQITYDGMIRGWFTGKAFDDYFNATKDDPVNARQIVNGNDKDDLIAGYHKAFLDAIKASIAPIP